MAQVTTYARPYLAELTVNLFKFTMKQNATNQFGAPIKAFGEQSPGLGVGLDLYLGTKNIGRQTYSFGAAASRPAASHRGLPPFSDIVSADVLAKWIGAFNRFIDVKMPIFDQSDNPAAAAKGAVVYPRINRIEASLPADKPGERFIAAIVGLYEDKDYQRQIIDADFTVLFVPDEWVARQANTTVDKMTPDQIEQLRALNDAWSLKEFLSDAEVGLGIVTVGGALYTTLKAQVFQYEGIVVDEIMEGFVANLAALKA